MKKQFKSILSVIAATLALSLIIQAPAVNAESLNNLKDQQKKIEQKKSKLNDNINDKSSKIDHNQSKQDKIMEQIQKLDKEINETDEKIDVVITSIEKTTGEIEVLQASIKELEVKIAERDALLQDRARAIQEGGSSINYVDVLLGANSFVDFIDRFSAVNTLLDADRKILQDQANDKKILEEQKQELEEKRQKQLDNRDKLEDLKKSLDSQKASKNKLVDELEAEQAKLKSQKKLLEKEYSEAINVSKKVEKEIANEQARLAERARKEAEAKAKARADAARAAKANAKANANAGGGTTNVSNSEESSNVPNVSSGTWTRPTNGTLTSGFGWRNIGAGPEFHYGVDLANAQGTPIVAAADGIIFRASPLSTYGNVIMITHSIEGNTFTTVYAHLSGYNASVGQSVSKGEVIGYMGQTGRAYGSHLHFEIHTTAWQGQRVGAVNPIRYISL
ncbi:peptidoglycan DD-metalloendopeptidase family protein [Viridibacillus sp. YIM B01967]|uniref:Peptidoglycan DD-metalloendopeptidase family protein n=1 Tax=Viridibacillus soli TaxID=2798301 RepID=A0ABS1H642_9BACL|nr:M23 family metallopeptidase [Viridibacillus soli]MBK3494866.1 peptidoglycan DD-metalloendopeptidase family protein [Viridibacillus soli]